MKKEYKDPIVEIMEISLAAGICSPLGGGGMDNQDPYADPFSNP